MAFVSSHTAAVVERGVLVLEVTAVDIGVSGKLVGLVVVDIVEVVVVVVVVIILLSLGLNTQDSPSAGKYLVSCLGDSMGRGHTDRCRRARNDGSFSRAESRDARCMLMTSEAPAPLGRFLARISRC